MTSKNFLKRYIPYEDKGYQWPQIVAIFIACLASFTLGTLFCWPSPSIPILISNSSHLEIMTIEQASYFSVIPPIAAAIASPIIAIMVDTVGRKKTVMLIAIPQFLSWVLIALAENIYMLYVSRLLNGIGDAALFGALPTYLGEISEPHIRGSWGNLIVIYTYLGQFLINVIGSYYGIRTTATVFGFFPVIHFILMTFLPESPYFLLMKNREDEARKSLKQLRWMKNVDEELSKLAKDVQRQISESGTLKDLLIIPTNRKALLISIAVRGCQQLSGLAAFAVYTQYIFNQAGGQLSASLSAIIFTAILFCAITGFSFTVDKFGRRPLMLFSCCGCFVVLTLEATYFYIAKETSINVTEVNWIPLAGMLIYIVLCAAGLGIIPTLMLGELFSASVKAKALCILNICFSIYVLSVSKMYQTLSNNFGMYVPFYLFSACCLVGAIFSYYFVPETKGKTLEEIQQTLRGNPRKEKNKFSNQYAIRKLDQVL